MLGLRLVPKSSIDHPGGTGSENCGSIVSLSNTDRLKAVGSPSTTDLNLGNIIYIYEAGSQVLVELIKCRSTLGSATSKYRCYFSFLSLLLP